MSSSTQPDDDIKKLVSSITPISGLTTNEHKEGAALVLMVMLEEDEWPLSKWQLKVNTNFSEEDDDWEAPRKLMREGPGITKLTTWGVEVEASRVEESGDNDNEERSMEGSSTDHTTSPRDFMSMVPITFNLEVGLILMIEEDEEEDEEGEVDPPNTLNLNNGDAEAKITTSNILSHWRSSPDCEDLARNINLNTSPSVTFTPSPGAREEEFTLNATWEEEEEEGVMTRDPSQLER
jgi:hypothetical protein